MWRQWLLITILAFAAGTGGLLLGRWLDQRDADRPAAADAPGEQRPEFELRGLDGNLHRPADWSGQVVLLNFWATWCAPCREEMPMLDELHSEYGDRGLQVVGIALDTPGAVRAFTERLGIDYPILLDGAGGDELMRRYGNTQGVLPFSVVIGRDGRIRRTLLGVLERDELLPVLKAQL